VCGLADNIIDKGVAILQYADDTIICLKDDMEVARNMKLHLYLYEMMSGLKINFLKSEIILSIVRIANVHNMQSCLTVS